MASNIISALRRLATALANVEGLFRNMTLDEALDKWSRPPSPTTVSILHMSRADCTLLRLHGVQGARLFALVLNVAWTDYDDALGVPWHFLNGEFDDLAQGCGRPDLRLLVSASPSTTGMP